MRKWISAIAALCLLSAGITTSASVSDAEATTTWPIELEGIRATSIVGFDNGNFTAVACDTSYPTAPSAI